MITIYKQELMLVDRQALILPKDSTILSIGNQNENLCLWYQLDTKVELTESRLIDIIGTGSPIDDLPTTHKRIFIGTVIMYVFVWHVFEVVKL